MWKDQTNTLVVLILSISVCFVGGKLIKSRQWHEIFVSTTGITHGTGDRVVYSSYKQCVAPGESQEKVEQKQEYNHRQTKEKQWSPILSIFTVTDGYEIYHWDYWKMEVDALKSPFHAQTDGTFFFLIIFLIFVFVYMGYVTVVGALFFTLFHMTWTLIFHQEVRKVGRRILITKEKMFLFFKSFLPHRREKRLGITKRHFRLPLILREYPEEEVPAELVVSEEDSDAGEVSSDGFEDLLHKGKDKSKITTHSDTKALIHLMASTEREMAKKSKKGSQTTMTESSKTSVK